ncbi:conserved hypothetical protein [Cupriavidus taiwanensis]|uniref:hypothetical protein n=1 Tax=Cupriavidus taiwanensis TaxID=164546 RepID=UPI000E12E56D|nr:hypothetical protein [Cupriavidus taiwanensis]SPA24537.1 conserved hypothetical protein [Cupriavidus taiwanensis]
MGIELWNKCALEGQALDYRVAELLGIDARPFSADWAAGGPLVESNQIYLQPPTTEHVSGGPNAGWHKYPFWRATVSAAVRTYPNPNAIPGLRTGGCVGRGMGSTPLVAAMRAIVNSFGPDAMSATPPAGER